MLLPPDRDIPWWRDFDAAFIAFVLASVIDAVFKVQSYMRVAGPAFVWGE